MPESSKPYLERKFYGRRKGRSLGKKRDRLVAELLPEITIHIDGKDKIDPFSLFDTKVSEIWFEVGFGQGEHMAKLAEVNPNIGFIGCEPFINGVSSLLVEIEENNLKNIRVWPNDARDLMDVMPDDCISRAFLIHPDPWHKTRHHKRRFIQPETVTTFARMLKSGAAFEVATDDKNLCDWMLQTITDNDAFDWTAECADDWRKKPADWPVLTKYGQKQLAGIPAYMKFIRK